MLFFVSFLSLCSKKVANPDASNADLQTVLDQIKNIAPEAHLHPIKHHAQQTQEISDETKAISTDALTASASLPLSSRRHFPALFTYLENDSLAQQTLSSLGLSQPSLDEAYIRIAKREELEHLASEHNLSLDKIQQDQKEADQVYEHSLLKKKPSDKPPQVSAWDRFAAFVKFRFQTFNKAVALLSVLAPLLVLGFSIAIVELILSGVPDPSSETIGIPLRPDAGLAEEWVTSGEYEVPVLLSPSTESGQTVEEIRGVWETRVAPVVQRRLPPQGNPERPWIVELRFFFQFKIFFDE
jgi:hypothetical protein